MTLFQIWREGFEVPEACSHAEKIGEEFAETFNEAVEKHITKYPKCGIDRRKDYYSDWGCRLYPSESEARRNFG